MSIQRQVIQIHPAAPLKPGEGTPCNGCGVCCLTEPCPLGVLLSGRRQGACDALRWSDVGLFYRCGAISEPKDVLYHALPTWIRPIAMRISPVMARLAKRWIAAGQGCDSTFEVDSPVGSTPDSRNSPTISPPLADLPVSYSPLTANSHDKPNSTSQEF